MRSTIRTKHNSNALIIFTREPEPGATKTRMMPYLTADKCSELHKCMLRDIAKEMRHVDADIIVAYTGGAPHFLKSIIKEDSRFRSGAVYIEQRGDGIGEKMENAIADAMSLGYQKAVLIGTDIPEIEAESIETAFALLDVNDVCIGPTEDGGYYLIGMKSVHHVAFDVKTYGVGTVFDETVSSMEKAGLKVGRADVYADMDTPDDAAGFRNRMREDAGLRHSFTGRFLRDNMSVSVIIPVYNESKEIGRMLEQMELYRNDCEIIFVDGGSTDNTGSLIEESGFRLIRSEKGRGVQMNNGALASEGDVLFFLHCDSVLPYNFIDEIRSVMSGHVWGCFGVKFPSRNFFMLTNRIISNHRAFCRSLPFGDQGIFIDRGVFFETGMFPELPIMEDYAFSRKLKRYGLGIGITKQRIVSSARRYGRGTVSILKTEANMWWMRYLFRKGAGAEELQKKYGDVR